MTTPAMDPSTLLPHRYPFLLVDRIDVVEPGRRASGAKLVTGSEWSIVGSRGVSGMRAMPHWLIVEALAQLSGAVLAGFLDGSAGAVGYFFGIQRARFRGEALPGHVLQLHAELLQFRRGICKTRCVARVGATRVVQAERTSILRPTTGAP